MFVFVLVHDYTRYRSEHEHVYEHARDYVHDYDYEARIWIAPLRALRSSGGTRFSSARC